MWVAFAFAKATHIFFSKNTCELDFVLTWTDNSSASNELIRCFEQLGTALKLQNSKKKKKKKKKKTPGNIGPYIFILLFIGELGYMWTTLQHNMDLLTKWTLWMRKLL